MLQRERGCLYESMWRDEAPRNERQTQALVLESVVCKIDKLLEGNPKVDDLAGCAVKANDQITKPLNIECAKAPTRKDCTLAEKPNDVPGVADWFTANYATGAASWSVDVATNDVEAQTPISVKIKCVLDTSNAAK